jgi:hypothetical protein
LKPATTWRNTLWLRPLLRSLTCTFSPGAKDKPEHYSSQSERIPPLPQGSKYGNFSHVLQATSLQSLDDFRLCAAQEWIGCLFQFDSGWQGYQVVCTQFGYLSGTLLQ